MNTPKSWVDYPLFPGCLESIQHPRLPDMQSKPPHGWFGPSEGKVTFSLPNWNQISFRLAMGFQQYGIITSIFPSVNSEQVAVGDRPPNPGAIPRPRGKTQFFGWWYGYQTQIWVVKMAIVWPTLPQDILGMILDFMNSERGIPFLPNYSSGFIRLLKWWGTPPSYHPTCVMFQRETNGFGVPQFWGNTHIFAAANMAGPSFSFETIQFWHFDGFTVSTITAPS